MNCRNKNPKKKWKYKSENQKIYLPSGNRQTPSFQDHPKPPTEMRDGKAPLRGMESWSAIVQFVGR